MRQQLLLAALTVCLFIFQSMISFLLAFPYLFSSQIIIFYFLTLARFLSECPWTPDKSHSVRVSVSGATQRRVKANVRRVWCGVIRVKEFTSSLSPAWQPSSVSVDETCLSSSTAFAVWRTSRPAKARYATRAAYLVSCAISIWCIRVQNRIRSLITFLRSNRQSEYLLKMQFLFFFNNYIYWIYLLIKYLLYN